jgi:curved DNA-binding protein CbpA
MTVTDDPFTTLGLPASAGLTDEDVRAAWRRIAAATHPDREDGGDPARFGAAAAAYATLRTSYGRGEALADLAMGGRREYGRRRPRGGAHRAVSHRAGAPGAVRGARAGAANAGQAGGRRGALAPGRGLVLRVASAALLAAATVAAVGVTPATIGLLAGALTVTGWALWRRGGWGQ